MKTSFAYAGYVGCKNFVFLYNSMYGFSLNINLKNNPIQEHRPNLTAER